jgi:hypothetical protein
MNNVHGLNDRQPESGNDLRRSVRQRQERDNGFAG